MVERFLLACSITGPQLTDPNQGQVTDSGADVVWTVDGCVIGFQVTEYHSDKGRTPNSKGSQLRREEKQKAIDAQSYAMFVVLDPTSAIVNTIAQKVERGNHADVQRFSSLVLLVVSSVPQDGGTAATFLLDVALDLPRLNTATAEGLSQSAYTSAYIFNVLSLGGGPSVYQWTREDGWTRSRLALFESPDGFRLLPASAELAQRWRQDLASASEPGLQTLRYLRSVGGPHPAPGSLSDGLDATFTAELLEALGGREAMPGEIEAFEQSWRERNRR